MVKEKFTIVQIVGFTLATVIIIVAFIIDFLTDLNVIKPITTITTICCFILQMIVMRKNAHTNKNDLIRRL